MLKRICFAYPWATAGGCERVFLNRAVELCRNYPDLEIDLFFEADCGGVSLLRDFLRVYRIDARVSVKLCYEGPYDCVFAIDYPWIRKYSGSDRVVWECHTPYQQNRAYLANIDVSETFLLFPAPDFMARVLTENPNLSESRCRVLTNFIPKLECIRQIDRLPDWKRAPLVFFGRMDRLKDPEILVRAYCELRNVGVGASFFLLFVGGRDESVDMNGLLCKYGLTGEALVMPPIPFANTDVFLRMVKLCKGIFVSPSHGESYGFSAAEAISNGVPSLLSDVVEHRRLIDPWGKDCCFRVGDYKDLAAKICSVAKDHAGWSRKMIGAAASKSSCSFIWQFEGLCSDLGVTARRA